MSKGLSWCLEQDHGTQPMYLMPMASVDGVAYIFTRHGVCESVHM